MSRFAVCATLPRPAEARDCGFTRALLAGALPRRYHAAVSVTGHHFILELYGCPPAMLDEAEHVRATLRKAIDASHATLLSDAVHEFTPHGVTALGLLSESHISVHTWPEHGYVAADIFTCGQGCSPESACEVLIAGFAAERYDLVKLERGRPSASTRPAHVPLPR
jgi:S-adenosylmethionine decarboxylase